jgi:hypothetical protein
MSGVIDGNGVQWEHCTVCNKWARLDALGYEPPSAQHPHGRDICLTCANAHSDIESIQPAPSWIPQYEAPQ